MGNSQNAIDFMTQVRPEVDHWLDKHLPPEKNGPGRLHEAMRYSVFAGGKRLRPALALSAYSAFHGKGDIIYFATSALEMFHTFSLIHDDLPCMDDDDLRRGRPTSHKVFGEATATLAGDALCIHAFELLAKTGSPETIELMSKALGTAGMLGGQMVDIDSEGKEVDLETVNFIHRHKTAALIEASILSGAILAGASQDEQKIVSEYGMGIGLAFQVVDDILDIEQTTEQLGKDAGSDLEKHKATYPSILGVEKSKQKAKELCSNAVASLQKLNHNTPIFEDIAEFILTRAN